MRWIVFGEDWASHPSSTQHLFRRFAMQDEVIWINSIGLRSPKLTSHDIGRVIRKGAAMLTATSGERSTAPGHVTDKTPAVESGTTTYNGKKISNGTRSDNGAETCNACEPHQPTHILAPRTLPFFSSSLVRKFNRYQLIRQIRALTQDKTPTVLWISLPSAVDLVGHCGEDYSIYYCGDDFSSLAGVDHKTIVPMEQELTEKCDLILTASTKLAQKFPEHKTCVLEHGVDYPLFSLPAEKPENFPMGKVMGFYGQLADWVDIDLLKAISQRFPDWTLMLIGAIHTHTSDLLEQPNVIWLDAIDHSQLAAYSQHWDIALLPFKACDQITHCNPLKLKEYLATGTEVVSLTFPAAEPYRELVHLADSPEHFIALLETLSRKTQANPVCNREQMLKRQAVVKAESWEHKADLINRLITSRRCFSMLPPQAEVCRG